MTYMHEIVNGHDCVDCGGSIIGMHWASCPLRSIPAPTDPDSGKEEVRA